MNNWRPISLGDCGTWLSGGTPANNADYWNGDIPWISGKSLHNIRVSDSEDKVTELGAKHGTRLVPANAILLLVRGMMLKKRIPVGITTRSVTFNQDVKALIPNNDIEPEFLLNWIIAHETELLYLVEESSHGTGKLSTDVLYDVEVLLPPLAEQRQIAAILSTWDEAITHTTGLIAALQRRKQALMQLLLTGAVRFPGFEDSEWETHAIGDVARVSAGYGFPVEHQGQTQGDIPFYKVSDMNRAGNEKYMFNSNNWVDHSLVKQQRWNVFSKGSVIFPKVGAAIATNKKRVLSSPSLLDNNLMAVKSTNDELNFDEYIYYLFLTTNLEVLSNMGALPSIRSSDIQELVFEFPTSEEQARIVTILSDFDLQLDFLEQYKIHLATQKRGLMQQLLTGAVRVPLANP